MSKKYILNSADKTLSPSRVYLENISSGVFKDLFSPGSSSYNDLLKTEEVKMSPNRSPFKRPKTKVKRGATLSKRNSPGVTPKKVCAKDGVSKPAQTNRVLSGTKSNLPKPAAYMAVVGRSVGLSSRAVPRLREMCVPSSSHAKLPSLHRAAITREVEIARKLCILAAIKPFNVESEKAKFFKSGFNYNPQFEYSNPVSSLVLSRHKTASDRFLMQVGLMIFLFASRSGETNREHQEYISEVK